MIHSPRFTAVLDANVIYPAPIRDLLLNLADLEIFSPKWSEIIHEEWIRNLLINRTDLSKPTLMRTVKIMNSAFPDAVVHGFEESSSNQYNSLIADHFIINSTIDNILHFHDC